MEEKNKELERVPFNTDIDTETRYEEHWSLFQTYEIERNKPIRFFNKNGIQRNIINYVKDSNDRMNEFHLKPSHKEDWQANTFDPITRDKVIAILSKIATARLKPNLIMKAKSLLENKGSNERKMIYSDLLENANIHNKDQQQTIWEMYTALSEGTVIGYEGWKKGTREVEYVKEYDPDTGERKTEKIKIDAWDDVFGEIVPIEEFYPETIWTNDIRNVKRCFRVQELTLSQFMVQYGKFGKANTVQAKSSYIINEKLPWGISENVDSKNVQVLHYYDEDKDKLGVWANGVELYYGPLPFNHKVHPFWLIQTEPIHHQFLYGKSLPDKLMGMQDIDNATFNAMLDQLFLSLNSPLFVDGNVDLEDGYLEPGRIYETDPGTKVQRAALGSVDSQAFNMLGLIKRSMEESSVSAQAQGVPTGGRKTKFEVQTLQEGAMNLAGLFLQLFEGGITHKYWLRMHNILQYYTMPSRVDSGKNKFKYIQLDNRMLTNGKIGKKMIQIVGSQEEQPGMQEMVTAAEEESGEPFDVLTSNIQPITITRDYLINKDFDFEIEIVPNSSVKSSEVDEKNKNIAFYQATREDPMYDQEMNAKDFARAFGKPEEIVKGQPQQQQGAMPGLPGMPGMEGQPAPGQGQPNLDLL
jgi:hypothetical protein